LALVMIVSSSTLGWRISILQLALLSCCWDVALAQQTSSNSFSVALFATMGTAIALFLISVIIYILCRRRCRRGRSTYLSRSQRSTAIARDGVYNQAHVQTDEVVPPKPAVVEKVPVEDKTAQTEEVSTSEEAVQTMTPEPAPKPEPKPEPVVAKETVVVEEKVIAVTKAPPPQYTETDVLVKSEPIEEEEKKEDEEPQEEEVVVVEEEKKQEEEEVITKEEDAKILTKTMSLMRKKSRDDITFESGWRKRVKLSDLFSANLIKEETIVELETETITIEEVQEQLREYLVGLHPIAGVYNDRSEEKMSLYSAYKAKIISRGTALSLLEAQAATGSIIDPITGDMMCVDDALSQGLLDRSFAAVLTRAERGVTGYVVKGTTEKMSLFQAMQAGFIVEKHGIRLLEAQIATGGIIDPVANHRLPVEVAFERGLFDQRLNKILQDPSDDTKGFLDPNTGENLTYLELIERCVEDEVTNLLLLPLVKEQETQLYKEKRLSSKILAERLHSRTSSSSSTRTAD